MSWTQRMIAARRENYANADSANCAETTNRVVGHVPIGANGTNGSGADPALEPVVDPIGALGTNGDRTVAATQSSAADPAALIDSYHERLAVCLEAGDVTESQAQAIAEKEVGADLDTLTTRQIQIWRASLKSVVDANDHWAAKVVQSCLVHLQSTWCFEAIKLGWTDVQLFGMHHSTPRVRVEAMGLIVSVACTALKGPLSVIDVDAADARILTGAGGRLIHQRFRPSLGPPIWVNPMFTNGHRG